MSIDIEAMEYRRNNSLQFQLSTGYPASNYYDMGADIDLLIAEVESLRSERDEAIKKYHAEIHDGRKRCEGIVAMIEEEKEKSGRLAGLREAVSVLVETEESGRTAKLEIIRRIESLRKEIEEIKR